MSSGSRPLRAAPPSPACGPDPVTRMPTTTVTATDAAVSHAMTAYHPGTTRTSRPATACTRTTSAAARATRTADASMCRPTTYGFRPVRTVMPPITACSGMYNPIPSASQNRSGRVRRIRTTSRKVTTATSARTKVNRRLPNSITPWMPISGVATRESGVHRGHVGQPRPDPVRRTRPPVPTMPICTTSVAHAAAITRPSTRRGSQPSDRGPRSVRASGRGVIVIVRSPAGVTDRHGGTRRAARATSACRIGGSGADGSVPHPIQCRWRRPSADRAGKRHSASRTPAGASEFRGGSHRSVQRGE